MDVVGHFMMLIECRAGKRCLLLLLMMLSCGNLEAQQSLIAEHQKWLQRHDVKGKSWTEIRDSQVVKQQLDYSCGAGAVATLLSYYYGIAVNETDVLKGYKFDRDRGISIAGLANVLRGYDFDVFTLGLSYATLSSLQVPAIVYLNVRGQGHFSVLKRAADGGAWLADPAWGNIRLSRVQFDRMWNTRNNAAQPGKVLVAIPKDGNTTRYGQEFFGVDNAQSMPNLIDSNASGRRHLESLISHENG